MRDQGPLPHTSMGKTMAEQKLVTINFFYMYVCDPTYILGTTWDLVPSMDRRKNRIPQNWSYGWLWTCVGAENRATGLLREQQMLLTTKPPLQWPDSKQCQKET